MQNKGESINPHFLRKGSFLFRGMTCLVVLSFAFTQASPSFAADAPVLGPMGLEAIRTIGDEDSLEKAIQDLELEREEEARADAEAEAQKSFPTEHGPLSEVVGEADRAKVERLDLDRNGRIEIDDAELARTIKEGVVHSLASDSRGDLNQDGRIDERDADVAEIIKSEIIAFLDAKISARDKDSGSDPANGMVGSDAIPVAKSDNELAAETEPPDHADEGSSKPHPVNVLELTGIEVSSAELDPVVEDRNSDGIRNQIDVLYEKSLARALVFPVFIESGESNRTREREEQKAIEEKLKQDERRQEKLDRKEDARKHDIVSIGTVSNGDKSESKVLDPASGGRTIFSDGTFQKQILDAHLTMSAPAEISDLVAPESYPKYGKTKESPVVSGLEKAKTLLIELAVTALIKVASAFHSEGLMQMVGATLEQRIDYLEEIIAEEVAKLIEQQKAVFFGYERLDDASKATAAEMEVAKAIAKALAKSGNSDSELEKALEAVRALSGYEITNPFEESSLLLYLQSLLAVQDVKSKDDTTLIGDSRERKLSLDELRTLLHERVVMLITSEMLLGLVRDANKYYKRLLLDLREARREMVGAFEKLNRLNDTGTARTVELILRMNEHMINVAAKMDTLDDRTREVEQLYNTYVDDIRKDRERLKGYAGQLQHVEIKDMPEKRQEPIAFIKDRLFQLIVEPDSPFARRSATDRSPVAVRDQIRLQAEHLTLEARILDKTEKSEPDALRLADILTEISNLAARMTDLAKLREKAAETAAVRLQNVVWAANAWKQRDRLVLGYVKELKQLGVIIHSIMPSVASTEPG